MCGGAGTRLWPLSRKSYPKQFLDLSGSGATMLQDTIERTREVLNVAGVIAVCNVEHRFLVAQQLMDINADVGAIILEPAAKNTAPAVTLAALQALSVDQDAMLLVLPADHIITDTNAFLAALERAVAAANDGYLVTFGVVPKHAETGFGYIKQGDQTAIKGARAIAAFKEKPDLASAEAYLAEGDYLWNSGMFVFKAERFIAEIKQHAPAIFAACNAAMQGASKDLDFTVLDEPAFSCCPSDSIDYAVMENTQRSAVVSLDAGWSDVGSWSGLWDIQTKDANANVKVGDVIAVDSNSSYLHSDSRLLATLGVNNLVVVETADAVLIADRNNAQNVKKVVSQLRNLNRSENEAHKVTHRPWGSYETIALSDRFQVKKIIVQTGQKLSLQLHHHRAEHWIVVSGTARVTCEDKVFTLGEDQSTYIPIGHKHRLENIGKIPLKLIEVQSGSYLGEDDIVRFDDDYGRTS
jgi:mannose-1-phosphate guanylyltransferase/mannose-6-phosphate isomerase